MYGNICCYQGPQGTQGPTGPKGSQGYPGAKGSTGPQGATGPGGGGSLPTGTRGDFLRYYNGVQEWQPAATSTSDNILIGTTTADSFSAGNLNNTAMGDTAGQGLYANPVSTITNTVSIGSEAGGSGTIFGGAAVDLEKDSVAVGNSAGKSGQEQGGVSVGPFTNEQYAQQAHSLSIGSYTSRLGQNNGSVMIGPFTGIASDVSFVGNEPSFANPDPSMIPGARSIGIGYQASRFDEAANSIAIGTQTHASGSDADAISVGRYAGSGFTINAGVVTETVNTAFSPSTQTISMGYASGLTLQGVQSVAIGGYSGAYQQGSRSIAIGDKAGSGLNIGLTPVLGGGQGLRSIAVGPDAGRENQSSESISIGYGAGQIDQGGSSISIGTAAGQSTQAANCVAIGNDSGQSTQGNFAISIGDNSGNSNQAVQAIALGKLAGEVSQGQNSVAIGTEAGRNNQAANTIVVNATGAVLENTTASTCVVKPVRSSTSQAGSYTNFIPPVGFDLMAYNQTTGEVISYTSS